MYELKTDQNQEMHTQANKSVLISTRLKGVSSVSRPLSRSSFWKNIVFSHTKIHPENVEVHSRKNKKTNITSQMHVVKTKDHVANVNVENALKANVDVICVSCDINVLIQFHDKCLASISDTDRMWIVDSGCSKHMTGYLRLGNPATTSGTLRSPSKHDRVHICTISDAIREREMEPRPEQIEETTPPLRMRSPRVRRQRERVVGFEENPNKEEGRIERNADGGRPSELEASENGGRTIGKGDLDNYLHLFEGAISMQKWVMPVACHMFTYTLKDSARIWWNNQKADSILNYEDLKAKFRSHFSQQKKFTKTHLAVHNIKQREGESTRDFTTRYTDDTLQILGLHEDKLISGFVHGLRTRNLVEFLSIDLPSTYKCLMEKTCTWIEASEVTTNGTLNDRGESFERSKKTSWDKNKGQKSKDRLSPYRGPNHMLLSKLSKSPREILATEKVTKSFKQPPHMFGNRWSCGTTRNDCRQLRNQIKEAVKLGQLSHLVKGIKQEIAKASDTQREKGRRKRE
ncbi:reverse transcriptase domain-containing protein [Tanacetum coccineum]